MLKVQRTFKTEEGDCFTLLACTGIFCQHQGRPPQAIKLKVKGGM